jgi:phosphoribosylanthranilate isomerase
MTALIAPGSVKICGNRDPELCGLAAEAGADLLGFIFVPGTKRYVEPGVAAECIDVAKRLVARPPLAVGVFVDDPPAQINEIARTAKLNLIQLHGRELPAELAEIELPVIKVIRPISTEAVADIKRAFESYLKSTNPPIAFLIDGFDAKHHGGAGVKADWDLASDLAAHYPILLAGGLNPENVADAIGKVGPLGVDVSSGVETDGIRDFQKIQSFISAAKKGFAKLAPRNTTVNSSSAVA